MRSAADSHSPLSMPSRRRRRGNARCPRDDSGERRDEKSFRIRGGTADIASPPGTGRRQRSEEQRQMANVLFLLAVEEGCRDRDHRLSRTASVQLCQVRWPWPPQALADGCVCLCAAPDDAGHMVFRTEDGTVLLELCLDETCQILKGIGPRTMSSTGPTF